MSSWNDGWIGLVSVCCCFVEEITGEFESVVVLGSKLFGVILLCCVGRSRLGEEYSIAERWYCGVVKRSRGTFVAVFRCWFKGW